MFDVDSGAQGGAPLVFSQRGDLKAFAWLSLRNGLLNLITLTLYRFWGKTEVRRRLWATTYLNNEPFEYTGRGVELFVGFVLAMLVLVVPFLAIVFGAQFLGPALSGLVVLPSYLAMGFLFGFARFTAFRYVSTRTAWRGVRFNLAGSPSAFAWAFLGYGALSAVTFGWFWPAAERRLAGRLWDGLRFGDQRLTFRIDDARKSRVYGAYALGWLISVLGSVIFVGMIMAVFASSATTATPPTAGQIGLMYAAIGGLILLQALAFAPFHAAMLRSIVAGIGLGEVRFRIKLRWQELALLNFTNVLLLAVSLGLLMPLIEARTRKFLINRLATRGSIDLENVRQVEAPAPRFGEGLADAFGVATV